MTRSIFIVLYLVSFSSLGQTTFTFSVLSAYPIGDYSYENSTELEHGFVKPGSGVDFAVLHYLKPRFGLGGSIKYFEMTQDGETFRQVVERNNVNPLFAPRRSGGLFVNSFYTLPLMANQALSLQFIGGLGLVSTANYEIWATGAPPGSNRFPGIRMGSNDSVNPVLNLGMNLIAKIRKQFLVQLGATFWTGNIKVRYGTPADSDYINVRQNVFSLNLGIGFSTKSN